MSGDVNYQHPLGAIVSICGSETEMPEWRRGADDFLLNMIQMVNMPRVVVLLYDSAR